MNLLNPPALGNISAILLSGFAPGLLAPATAAPPAPEARALREGVSIEMIAEHPAVVTPIGLDVDVLGKVWLVASHTHETPKDYQGPDRDEVLVFAPDGKRTVFYNETVHTMDLELGRDGWV